MAKRWFVLAWDARGKVPGDAYTLPAASNAVEATADMLTAVMLDQYNRRAYVRFEGTRFIGIGDRFDIAGDGDNSKPVSLGWYGLDHAEVGSLAAAVAAAATATALMEYEVNGTGLVEAPRASNRRDRLVPVA